MALSFYDHSRQPYAPHVPLSEGNVGEFMVGEYVRDGGVRPGGEFAIVLRDHRGVTTGAGIAPQLQVFGDGTGALKTAIDLGLLDALSDVESAEEFGRRLIALGIRDRSAVKLPKEGAPA